jgi:hypothetical protein
MNSGLDLEAYLDGNHQRFRWLERDEERNISSEKIAAPAGDYSTRSTIDRRDEHHEQAITSYQSRGGQAHGAGHHKETKSKRGESYCGDTDRTVSDEQYKKSQEQDVAHMGQWMDNVSGIEWEE